MALWNFESAKKAFTWKKTLIYYAAIWIYSIGQFIYSVTNIRDVFKSLIHCLFAIVMISSEDIIN